MDKIIPITREQSKTLSLLKGLAILLVLMIHCHIGPYWGADKNSVVDLYLQCLTRELVYNAVPLFFFISGYLFFLRKDSYLSKWKKRIKTLVVPYLIWCGIGFFIPFFFQCILGMDSLYRGGHLKLISQFSGLDYLRIFWDIREGNPILSTLWFLKHLIILVAMTPVIEFLSKKMKFLFPVVLFLNYIYFHKSFLGLWSDDLFFFGMGAWLSITFSGNGLKFFDMLKFKWLIPFWGVLILVTMFCYYTESDMYLIAHNLFVIVNCLLMYKIVRNLVQNYELNLLQKISTASFFIYLVHEPWLGYAIGLFFRFIHPSEYVVFILPFIFCIFTVIGSYLFYLILKKCCPRFLGLVTGAR